MPNLLDCVFPLQADEGVGYIDALITLELHYAGIPTRRIPEDHRMHYTVVGELADLTFTREHRFWSAEGVVPLSLAEKLFKAPGSLVDFYIGAQDKFLDPNDKIAWITSDGKHVRPTKEEAAHRESLRRHPERDDVVFSDDPASIASPFIIDGYTVLTYRGLRLFAEALRANSLA